MIYGGGGGDVPKHFKLGLNALNYVRDFEYIYLLHDQANSEGQ